MNQRTLLTRNMHEGERIVLDLNDGETVSLNDGRVVITLLYRSGRLSRLAFEMDREVRVVRAAPSEPAQG